MARVAFLFAWLHSALSGVPQEQCPDETPLLQIRQTPHAAKSLSSIIVANTSDVLSDNNAAEEVALNSRSAEGQELVNYLYTFAAPPMKKWFFFRPWRALLNGARADGCFPGLRIWSRLDANIDSGLDPVACKRFGFHNVRQATLEIRPDLSTKRPYSGDYTKHKCEESQDSKPEGLTIEFPNFNDRHNTAYWFNYQEVGQPELYTFWEFNHRTSSDDNNPLFSLKDGYRAVGLARVNDNGGDVDIIGLYQHTDTLGCFLAIEGSDMNVADWLSNLNWFTTNFCGMRGIQQGFAEEFRNLLKSKEYIDGIKSKLPQCGTLTVSGHSKGGGLANLFAACANSDRNNLEVPDHDKDYDELVKFDKFEQAQRLPPLNAL